MNFYTHVRNTKTNGIITNYQALQETFKDKFIAGDTWTYLGPKGIILTPGYWLISYCIRMPCTNEEMDCSIRSTNNNNVCQSLKTNAKNLIVSAELTELAHISNDIYNLYPQIYVPKSYTFDEIIVRVTCVRLKA